MSSNEPRAKVVSLTRLLKKEPFQHASTERTFRFVWGFLFFLCTLQNRNPGSGPLDRRDQGKDEVEYDISTCYTNRSLDLLAPAKTRVPPWKPARQSPVRCVMPSAITILSRHPCRITSIALPPFVVSLAGCEPVGKYDFPPQPYLGKTGLPINQILDSGGELGGLLRPD